jgi:hypothetical protein
MTNVGKFGLKEALEVQSFIKGWYDIEFRVLGYLMAAHATGMIVCLSALKDYKDTTSLKGIGILVVLFGLGLILSALAFITLGSGIERVFRHIAQDSANADERQSEIKIMGKVYLVIGMLSCIMFVVAIGIVIYRFGGL